MISVIVPAHNEEQLIGTTLSALAASLQGLSEPAEVIVVDDASTDRTQEIVKAAGVRMLSVNLRHIAAVRNAGAVGSRGERLLFVDADTVVTPNVVRAAVRAMHEGCVGGGATVMWEGKLPPWARLSASVTRWTMRVGNFAAGCFVFATREAFEAVGGFDTRLYVTEELALSRALKRIGRFVVLREHVVTSGRKLRTHSVREILRMTVGVSLRGSAAFRDRSNLSLWYGDRRNE